MKRAAPALLALLLVTLALPAAAISPGPSNADPAIIRWQPPSTFQLAPSGGRTPFADISAPLPFIAVAACRQYDSRSVSVLADNTPRAVTLSGAPCGIPVAAQAVAINITVFSITGAGSNGVFKVGNASPPTIAWINYPATETQRGNAGVVSVAAGAVLYVQVNQGAGFVNFVVDVFGYYSNAPANLSNVFLLTSNASNSGTIRGENTGSGPYSSGILGISSNTDLTSAGTVGYNGAAGTGVFGWSASTGRGVFGQSAGGPGVWGESTTGTGEGVHGKSAGGVGVLGESTAGGAAAVLGVNNTGVDGTQGVGGYAGGAAIVHGVQGQMGPGALTGSSGVHGIGEVVTGTSAVRGDVNGITLTGTPGFTTTAGGIFRGVRGVLGYSQNGFGAGVVGAEANPAGTLLQEWGALGYNGYAVYGSGNGAVTGSFSKGSGSFKIDHPLDPEKKYLYHSFVESPDMMNVYNGLIELGADGSAVVKLPSYFEALNRDFRYQLTSIGMPQPGLYVALEVANNEFVVSGGQAYGRVSWQVTGVRKDPFANAHRIIPEVEKEPELQGYYLHASEYGKETSKSLPAHELNIRETRDPKNPDALKPATPAPNR